MQYLYNLTHTYIDFKYSLRYTPHLTLIYATPLHRTLSSLGIMVIFVAMVLVASTTFFAPAAPATTGSSAGKDPRIGVVLVVLGCMAQGVQCTLHYVTLRFIIFVLFTVMFIIPFSTIFLIF